MSWLKNASSQSNCVAASKLALLHLHGDGIKKHSRGNKIFCRIAANELSLSNLQLAHICLDGNEVSQASTRIDFIHNRIQEIH